MSEESKMLPKSSEATPTLKAIAPCLRSKSENPPKREDRKVCFPNEENDLVTGHLEPANPWEYGKFLCYIAFCMKLGVYTFLFFVSVVI